MSWGCREHTRGTQVCQSGPLICKTRRTYSVSHLAGDRFLFAGRNCVWWPTWKITQWQLSTDFNPSILGWCWVLAKLWNWPKVERTTLHNCGRHGATTVHSSYMMTWRHCVQWCHRQTGPWCWVVNTTGQCAGWNIWIWLWWAYVWMSNVQICVTVTRRRPGTMATRLTANTLARVTIPLMPQIFSTVTCQWTGHHRSIMHRCLVFLAFFCQ